MELEDDHGRRIDAAVCEALTECNGGRPLESWEEWLRVGMRVGIRRIEFHDRETVPEPMLRYDDEARSAAVLYLPYPRSRRELYCWLLHEYGEAAMGRDLAAPFLYPSEWGDHHAMAQVVEMHHQRPIASLGSLDDVIPDRQ